VESVEYLFLSSPHFGSIWQLLQRWIDISVVDPLCLSDHFMQYGKNGWKLKKPSIYSKFNLVCVFG